MSAAASSTAKRQKVAGSRDTGESTGDGDGSEGGPATTRSKEEGAAVDAVVPSNEDDELGGVTPQRRWGDVRGRHFTYNDFLHRNPMGRPRKVDSHPVNIYKS